MMIMLDFDETCDEFTDDSSMHCVIYICCLNYYRWPEFSFHIFWGSCSLVDNDGVSSSASSNISDDAVDSSKEIQLPGFHASDAHTETASLLDLYSGCGAMSTGLCLGAALSNFKLETVCFVLIIC